MKKLCVTLCLLALVACAKSPSSIPATAINSSEYEHLSCEELAVKHSTASTNLTAAIEEQNNAQVADAIGVFLVLIPVSALAGDAEADVAQYKGETQAIQRAMDKKEC